MKKYTLYTYDLWSDGEGYSVNNVYQNETVEAENIDDAINQFCLKTDMIEEDNNVDNSMGTIYFNYKAGKYSGYPACEIREKQ